MLNLFLRTLSQGLQVFVPIGAALVWYDRCPNSVAASAVRRGLILSIPLTALGGWAFQRSTSQAHVETLFAIVVAVIAAAFVRDTWRSDGRESPALGSVGVPLIVAAAALIVVRQTQVVSPVLWTALVELRSGATTIVILAGLLLAMCAATGWMWVGRRVSLDRLRAGTRVFGLGFFAQVCLFGLHEATETGWLPWSETLHSATEPYGPDGRHGVYLSALLLVVALAALASPARVRRHINPNP